MCLSVNFINKTKHLWTTGSGKLSFSWRSASFRDTLMILRIYLFIRPSVISIFRYCLITKKVANYVETRAVPSITKNVKKSRYLLIIFKSEKYKRIISEQWAKHNMQWAEFSKWRVECNEQRAECEDQQAEINKYRASACNFIKKIDSMADVF